MTKPVSPHMTAPKVVTRLAESGVLLSLTAEGELRYKARPGVLTPDVIARLKAQKEPLKQFLQTDEGDLLMSAMAAEAALTEAEQEYEQRKQERYVAMIRAAQYAAEADTMPMETITLSKGVTVANPNEWFRRAVGRAKELKAKRATETRAEQRFWLESRMDNLNADLETVAQWYADRERTN